MDVFYLKKGIFHEDISVLSFLKSLYFNLVPRGFSLKVFYPWRALHNAPVACVKNVSNNFIRDYIPWGNKYFLVIFASVTLKLEKFGAVYSSFNPCAALLFVLKDNRKQIQWLLKDPFA